MERSIITKTGTNFMKLVHSFVIFTLATVFFMSADVAVANRRVLFLGCAFSKKCVCCMYMIGGRRACSWLICMFRMCIRC